MDATAMVEEGHGGNGKVIEPEYTCEEQTCPMTWPLTD